MKSSLPKISAIITTYNSRATIQRVIDSLKKQEGINVKFEIEIIIIDDCSTDETLEIISSNNLDFISTGTNSGGPNKGRNLGLKKATGDYICIVDHDDEWHPYKILKLLPYFKNTHIVTSGFIISDSKTGKKSTIINQCDNKNSYILFEKNSTFINKLCRNNKGQNTYLGSIMYSKHLKHILFEEKFGMIDYDWLLKLFYNQSSIEVCEALYTRYVHGINLSLNENYRLNDYNYSIEMVQDYKQKYPKEVSQSVKKINGSLARYYYLVSNMPKARHYFLKADFSLKTMLYFLTSFIGADFVKKKFNVFG